MFNKWQSRLEQRIEKAMDQMSTPSWFSFEGLLYALSKLYAFGVRTRLWLFEKKIIAQKTLPCFVISIGNISVGGTGKTPMAVYLARTLIQTGKKPVIISHGYKGNYKTQVLVVSDGDQVFADSQTAGDEPYMIAQQKICPVVVGKSRYAAGKKAIEKFNPDVIILDDGFQHLSLKRDLDFLLFDYSNPLGNFRLLPSGRLREPVAAAAKRAHALIFTRCPSTILQERSSAKKNQGTIDGPLQSLNPYFNNLQSFKTCHVPYICEYMIQGKTAEEQEMNMETLKGKKVILFSGLARNHSFYRTIKDHGAIIADHLEFKDHYRYKRADFEMINETACRTGADIILTTQKDRVKFTGDIKWDKDLAVIGIDVRFQFPEKFLAFLDQQITFLDQQIRGMK